MKTIKVNGLAYPSIKADLERCNKQLGALCSNAHDGTAVMSVPPDPTDFDMQFYAAFDELAEYRSLGSLDRLRELAEAEKDGRCVILPCKVGDTVYVDKRTIYDGWRTKGISSKIAVGKVVAFSKNKQSTYMKIEFLYTQGARTFRDRYVISAIGKTVFLSREAAAKALEAAK